MNDEEPATDETLLAVAVEAAQAGGAQLMAWRDKFTVREKAPSDLVTDADFASQRAIQEIIAGRFPEHGFLGEEGLSITGQRPGVRWIIDPLDGTVNYAHSVPGYCVSIALEDAGRLRVGVVFDPIANELFTATAGGGAALNGRPIAVSRVTKLADAMMVASFAAGVTRESPEITNFVEVLVQSQSLRRTGSAALNLAFVAMGRFDGYWATSTKAWDIAAGWLIVQEAGGVIAPFQNAELELDRPQFIAAAAPQLAAQLQQILVLPG